MVRPKFTIHEGSPIYGPGSEPQSRQNAEFAMESNDIIHPAASTIVPSSATQKLSSLQRAARGSSANRKDGSGLLSLPKKKTSYTIGGPATIEATTTATSSCPYANGSNLESQSNGQSSIPVMGSQRTQQNHFNSYTVGVPRQQNASPAMIPYAVIDNESNDQEMEMNNEQVSSYGNNNNCNSNDNCGGVPHHHEQYSIPNLNPDFRMNNHHSPVCLHPTTTPSKTRTSYEIGECQNSAPLPLAQSIDKMEGVQDHGSKMPLVVLDGANVAHNYADALASMNATFSPNLRRKGKPEPDARGIQVAMEYFMSVNVRVLVVLPQYWMRRKPRPGDAGSQNAMMETDQFEILKHFNDAGLIVASPPADDDDAYALMIAQREEARAVRKRNGEGPGFVLSNDMFRDAQARDSSGVLKTWLVEGRNETIGPGRISFAFCDMGTMDDRGDRILDFVPNPRHPFVIYVEGLHHQSIMGR